MDVSALEVRGLLDRYQIEAVIAAYTRAVDTRNFADLREVFTADAVLDYSSVGGPVDGVESQIAWLSESLSGFERYQHLLGQVLIDFDGADRASATAYFTNPMVALDRDGNEQVLEVGGYYHHIMVRTPDGWRSTHLVDEVVWTKGW